MCARRTIAKTWAMTVVILLVIIVCMQVVTRMHLRACVYNNRELAAYMRSRVYNVELMCQCSDRDIGGMQA